MMAMENSKATLYFDRRNKKASCMSVNEPIEHYTKLRKTLNPTCTSNSVTQETDKCKRQGHTNL